MVSTALNVPAMRGLDRGNILISGAAGMLGQAFTRQLAARTRSIQVSAFTHQEWDVTDSSGNEDLARWVEGGWIIHCAALVDVEACVRNPEVARKTIVGGASNVASIAAASGARILFPQSFLIYDGLECPITETTKPNPLSTYGELKLEAEAIVAAQSADNLIVRMAGFFGGEAADKNFVGRIIPRIHAAILAGEPSFAIGSRVWQPTYTADLALNSLLLAARGRSGVYVMASHGEASFREVAAEIARNLGWTGRIQLVEASSEEVTRNEVGRRPDRAVMVNSRLQAEGLDRQRPWRDALAEYLTHEYFDCYRM